MYRFARRLLFRLDPERAHALSLGLVRLAGALPLVAGLLRRAYAAGPRPVEVFGLRFTNPVGLAAGYDKDGLGWRGLACLGFGHIEVGTITPRPQPGNPRPRLYRLPEDRALINRMGFPGRGGAFAARRLAGRRPAGLVLGVNLGKNKDTPLEAADQDYCWLIQQFAPLADYLAINVSSPNTVGLRRLQERQALEMLLAALQAERQVQAARLGRPVPLLVKLAPDLEDTELDDALDVILSVGLDGVIAANTTVQRPGLRSAGATQSGGLSGAPLFPLSSRMVAAIHARAGDRLPVIAVGGIGGADDARRMLDLGARLCAGLHRAGIRRSIFGTIDPGWPGQFHIAAQLIRRSAFFKELTMPRDYQEAAPAEYQRRPELARDEAWIRAFLRRGQTAHVAHLSGDQPFITPTNYWFDEERRQIIFHSNLAGRVRSNLEHNPHVCIEVSEYGRLLPANTALEFSIQYRSVMVYGTVQILEDPEECRARPVRADRQIFSPDGPRRRVSSDSRWGT